MDETLAEMPEGDDLIDRDTAAEILGIHPQTIMRYGREGKLTRYRIGPRMNTRAILRFSRSEVETLRDQVVLA